MDAFIFHFFWICIGFIVLSGIYAYARRCIFIAVCGISLLLISPWLAQWLTSTQSSFDTWLWTFRLIGLCAFVWGLVENVTEAFRDSH